MMMRINARTLIKELLKNENLIVNYNELNNGGFELSVRIDEEALNRPGEINKIIELKKENKGE